MTMDVIKCKECGINVDVTSAKSPRQVKYCDKCRDAIRNQRAKLYYENRKRKCSCGANNNKNKIRCWRCGKGFKQIRAYSKPKIIERQLEILA